MESLLYLIGIIACLAVIVRALSQWPVHTETEHAGEFDIVEFYRTPRRGIR